LQVIPASSSAFGSVWLSMGSKAGEKIVSMFELWAESCILPNHYCYITAEIDEEYNTT
jgi:hypothetical protein